MDAMLIFLITLTSISFGGFCIFYIVKKFISIPETHYHFTVNQESEQQPTQADPSDILSLDVTYTEYHKVINFMLLYGLIENEQYQQLQSSATPYLTQERARW
jgi:hypothetical protein